ncbi:PfkB family carbohydrate kinase [Leifsonia sp. RAF41]|uniref:PfkB family carbohydrate kinase n=1 Tax=Leifsonia sp. RAF41 TaxID=3233056 RepID=UPI003F9EB278
MSEIAGPGNLAHVAVLGDNTIDEYVAPHHRTFVGGNALNVSVQIVRAGVPTDYFGAVAADPYGTLIRSTLEAQGVGARGVTTLPGRTALTRIELTADNDRVFLSEDFGVTADYAPSSAEIDRIAQCSWVHIGMLPAASRVKAELRRRQPKIVISQDVAVTPIATDTDVAFASAGENSDPSVLAARLLREGARLAVVTQGADGAYATNGTDAWSQTAFPTRVVDTTGAGDSFIAGFITARLSGANVSGSLRAGAHLASVTCTHPGGFPQ